MMHRWALPISVLPVLLFALPIAAHADGAGDNAVDNVRHIPPLGVTVSDPDRAELQNGLNTLEKAIAGIKGD